MRPVTVAEIDGSRTAVLEKSATEDGFVTWQAEQLKFRVRH
jgi:hypothetical protein